MIGEMFCFQCEQTAGCKGCTGKVGVCGKTSAVAFLQDELTGVLIGYAASNGGNVPAESDAVVLRALFSTLTNVDFDEDDLRLQISAVKELCPSAETYPMANIWSADEDVRSLKSLVLFGLRGLAAYAYHAMVLGQADPSISSTIYNGLALLSKDVGMSELLPMAMEIGKSNLLCMELLDKANTGRFGIPEPTVVTSDVEAGPAIVVTGHDLEDLELLLEQTVDKGVSVYTHGEMLPAHAYPGLKKYPHLKGNYGSAWQNQKSEFDAPVAVLFTTNCLMPPKDSYKGNLFTTGPVSYPGVPHIGSDKDFTVVIEKALELGGFEESTEGGPKYTVGFGHGTVLSVADKVVEAVKGGDIRHFFLVGGCDGAKGSRGYYREFVEMTPADSVVLTLACGKYRFNDLDLGTIGGLPRLMDMGQCNDAYGAIKVAVALSEVFGCGVNDLPLSMVLSWYEQKAVAILLTLLYLGIKGIYLGPSLPAFVTPNVLDFLVNEFDVHLVSDPRSDMEAMLKSGE